MSEPLRVSFTGHRPSKGIYGYAEHARWAGLADTIEAALRLLLPFDGRPMDVVTGGAQGVDQVAFWAARRLREDGLPVRLVVCEPFGGFGGNWRDDGGDFTPGRYARLLSEADEIVRCHPDPPASWEVGRLLQARNEEMLDRSDLLIAVTSMDPDDMPRRGSGTANAIRSAMRRGMTVLRINPYRLRHGMDVMSVTIGSGPPAAQGILMP